MGGPDDGRLELDDDGRVLDAGQVALDTLDLTDPRGTQPASPSPMSAWTDTTLLPWGRRHRRGIRLASGVVALTVAVSVWADLRPAEVAPAVPLEVSNAVLDGGDLGGPQFDGSGRLAIAYAVRSTDPAATFMVTELTGPGLTPLDVRVGEGQDTSLVTGSRDLRVQARADVHCDDPRVATAQPSSYSLVVERNGPGSAPDGAVPLPASTSHLDVAIRDHCLADALPNALAVVEATVTPQSGSSIAALAFVVRNDGAVPLAVSTERSDLPGMQVDRSPTAVIAAGSSALLETRVLVRDCSAPPRLPGVLSLPRPVTGSTPDAALRAGVTLRIGYGDRSTLASYPVPMSVQTLRGELARSTCAAHPKVTASMSALTARRSVDGAWRVSGSLTVLTSGIGVTVGREDFTGPAWGAGSTLVTGGPVTPDSPWTVAPVTLDRGAGTLLVTFHGTSCTDALRDPPSTLAVHVLTADRSDYPFEVALDGAALRSVLRAACAVAGS
jgi:hypothetical protein